MLQHFTLKSDPLTYTNNIAPVSFSRKPSCDSAIIGISAIGNLPLYALRTLVQSLLVDGREYKQGDDFPLAMIERTPIPLVDSLNGGSPAKTFPALTNTDALDISALTQTPDDTPIEVPFNSTWSQAQADEIDKNFKEYGDQLATQRTFNTAVQNALATLAQYGHTRLNYWPGSLLQLRDGTRVGGIRMDRNARVSMRLQDATAGSAQLARIVLHCVAFPQSGQAGRLANPMRQRFMNGEGELVFVGNSHAYTAALNGYALTAKPNPQSDLLARRLRVRGGLYVTASNVIVESEFRDLLVQVGTESQRPPHDSDTPAREVIGYPGLDWHTAEVDLNKNEEADVRVTASTPSASRTLRLVSIFEGRNPDEEFLETAKAA